MRVCVCARHKENLNEKRDGNGFLQALIHIVSSLTPTLAQIIRPHLEFNDWIAEDSINSETKIKRCYSVALSSIEDFFLSSNSSLKLQVKSIARSVISVAKSRIRITED